MSKDKHNLKDKLNKHQSDVDVNAIWSAIEPEVDAINAEKKKKKRGFFWLCFFGFTLLGVGVWYFAFSDRQSNAGLNNGGMTNVSAKENATDKSTQTNTLQQNDAKILQDENRQVDTNGETVNIIKENLSNNKVANNKNVGATNTITLSGNSTTTGKNKTSFNQNDIAEKDKLTTGVKNDNVLKTNQNISVDEKQQVADVVNKNRNTEKNAADEIVTKGNPALTVPLSQNKDAETAISKTANEAEKNNDIVSDKQQINNGNDNPPAITAPENENDTENITNQLLETKQANPEENPAGNEADTANKTAPSPEAEQVDSDENLSENEAAPEQAEPQNNLVDDYYIPEDEAEGEEEDSEKINLAFWQMALRLESGAAMSNRTLTEKDVLAEVDLLALREKTEKALETINFGLHLDLAHKSGLELSAGLHYTRIGEFFELNETRYETDSISGIQFYYINLEEEMIPVYGMVPDGKTIEERQKFYNYSHLLDIPVSAAYHHKMGKFSVGLSGTVFNNISLKTKGRILNEDYTAIDLKENQDQVYRKSVGVSFMLGVPVRFALADKLQIQLTPYWRTLPKSFTLPSYTLEQKYNLLGLNLGLRWQFGQ